MNRIYKLVWNPQLRAMVVASELASGQGRASAASSPVAPRLALLSAACGMALMATAFGARAQQAELADLQNLVARYSQPVEDLSALVARASGTAQVSASASMAPASVSVSANVAVSAQASVRATPALPVVRKVRHAGLSVTPAVQVQTVASALANASVGTAGLQPGNTGIASSLSAVSESLAGSGTGQAGAPAGRLLAALRPRDPAIDNRTNPVREGLVTVVGLVEDGTGKLLDKTHLGQVASGLLDGVGSVVAGVGNVAGAVVGGLTGSQALAGTVTGLTDAVDGGLSAVGDNLEDTNLAGVVGAVGGTVHNAGNAVVGGLTNTVGGVTGSTTQVAGLTGVVGGLTGGLSNGLANTVGSLTGNVAPSSVMVTPMALQPGDPRLVPGGSRTSGLVVGTGGLVGTVGTLLGPTLQDLLGGDGYVRNGDTAINSANIVQAYSVTNVLGLPVVNLSPVGTLLDGLGGVTTGSNSHLTVLGGATSDSYIYNINNGDPNGLLGLVLPDSAPAWAQSCLNVLGLASIDCWAVNAAQDYQVLIGDGAYANGSKEVVIGTNARHQLPLADANDVFTGNGVNDPTNPTGVPTADYDARLGHSVVIGDNALGTANAQTLIGAGATSDKANSVALGFKSNASRGGMDNYSAYGLTAAQTSIGEVAVGSAGRERQITHVAAGSGDTDAVNVAQLRSAISTVSVGSNPFSVLYADNGAGAPDYTRIALGDGTAATTISNLADGEVSAGSSEAVNGAQLHGTADSLAAALGGNAAVNADGTVSAPTYTLSSVAADGSTSTGDYNDVGSAFDAMDQSINNINTTVTNGLAGAVRYDTDASGAVDFGQVTFGDGNGPTRLTNVADGAVAAGSSDAVTGSQLHAASASVATNFGGGSAIAADGSVTAPTYTLTSVAANGSTSSADYNDVGSAFDAVDQSITNINTSITTGLAGAVRYDIDASGAVDYSQVTLGDGNGPTRLTNVADGSVAAGSSDALTGAQLYSNASSVAAVIGAGAGVDANGNLTAPSFAITSIDASLGRTTGNYSDVGTAFSAMDASINNVANNLSVAIGGAVLYDRDAAGAVDYTRVTFGDGNAPTLLTNVAAGSVLAGSADAVTGGQLHGNASSVAAHLGGGAAVAADGSVTAPTYAFDTVDGNGNLVAGSYSDVGSAFDAVGQSIRNIFNNGTGATDPLAVRYLADAQGNPSNLLRLTGSGSGAVSITNLAAAQVVAGSTDAVNGDQLAATNAALSTYLGGTTSFDGSSNAWVGPTFALTTVAADGTLSTSTFNDVTAAFNSVSQSLTNISNVPPGTPSTTPSPYLDVNSTGAPAQATGSEAIALGSAASSDGQAAVAIGQGASASAANSVALGAGSVADRANTVSVGAAGDERQITHVADASQATDAVNLRQLQASQQGTVRYDQNTDGSTNYNSITLGQTSSGPALVRNVAAGVSSTDAVNVGQMQAGLDQVKDWSRNYTDDRFNSVSRDMRDIDNRASAGIASAMAMAGLPQPYEAGRSMASFAASSFNGEGSIAVGISGVSEGGRWIYKLSGSANTRGDGGVTVGAGIQW
ncbi:hypothetical protein ABB30_08760 [Stenotrophomonas ginsengisoli]|uniref:Hemagglutinin n=1 Tax=Stenotrophomonas ginsengisoli TaxID=336566 RepID=A0A0R0D3V3_9GAMM|nr:YadA-like family protein [Stenotrophomonas ginsengisoli]KRG76797.1 hypothetical protein ABB30_08760 [Stenotrophomonas ginsengisoli]